MTLHSMRYTSGFALSKLSVFWYYKHKMNPQDPRYNSGQGYQQPTPYSPPTPPAQPTLPSSPQVNPQGGYDVVPAPKPNIPNVSNGGHNPYEFIIAQNPVGTKKGAGNMTIAKRILLALIGLAVLAGIVIAGINFFVPKDPTLESLVSIAQTQQEIIRVTTQIDKKLTNSDLVNYVVNVNMSVGSDQAATIKYLSTRKFQIPPKTLPQKADSKTDTLLSEARATNTLDVTAHQAVQKLLVDYQKELSSTYKTVTGENAKKLLQTNYDHVTLLITQGEGITL